jgi:anaphase-promoting complex subunit 5
LYWACQVEASYASVSSRVGLEQCSCTEQHSADWEATEVLLSSLKPDESTDPELSFQLSESRIECLVARGLYPEAFDAIEDLSTSLKEEGADVMERISILIAKADLFRRIGKPEQGFSVALRAASVSFKARLMPCLWVAVGLLANILNTLAEFDAASRMLHAVIPQVRVCHCLALESTNRSIRVS